MLYNIVIDYTTGGSFSSERKQETIELDFSNIDIIKENLKRIKEHEECYQQINSRKLKPDDKQKICESLLDKKWFSPKYYLLMKKVGLLKKKIQLKNFLNQKKVFILST